jgi:cyclophilin family peptidyl-prolyl cis-trans isomerase/HEAT repeat protein
MAWSSPRRRSCWVALAALICAGCASAGGPPAGGPGLGLPPPPASFEQKIAAILRLEDLRVLDDAPAPPPAVTSLLALLTDPEGAVRRRAALGVGRVGMPAGVAPLSNLLVSDVEPEVRAMAAFALGLIGDGTAVDALTTALANPDPRVQGRAAEALGLIGAPAKGSAGAIARMIAGHIGAGALASIGSDDQRFPEAPPAEAVRLGAYALVRLGDVTALRSAILAPDGNPASDWWPLAFAMQRLRHADTQPTLRAWLFKGGATTRAFAIKGLGELKDAGARQSIEALVGDARQPLGVRVQSIRALGAIADARSAAVLTPLLVPATPRLLRLEAAAAVGALARPALADSLIDYLEEDWAPMRAAAQAAMASSDTESFMPVLSGLDNDREWNVRAALATTLGTLPPEAAGPRLVQLAGDADGRVVAAALRAMAKLKLPGAEKTMVGGLAHQDVAVRIAAAEGLGVLKPAGAAEALAAAYEASATERGYAVRAALLAALASVQGAAAAPRLTAALSDPDWAVRLRAASLLRELTPGATVEPARPAPPNADAALEAIDQMVAPQVSPHAYIRTSKGELRAELAVIDAPRAVANFTSLVRRGFFDGVRLHRVVPDFVVQDGDPRGDGEGGPGYTIRDELNQRPFLRGTIGMALDWEDTGGSQFFIALSPQPHLDARYTAFGQVMEGMAVVEALEPWDVIEAVRIWDGKQWVMGPGR